MRGDRDPQQAGVAREQPFLVEPEPRERMRPRRGDEDARARDPIAQCGGIERYAQPPLAPVEPRIEMRGVKRRRIGTPGAFELHHFEPPFGAPPAPIGPRPAGRQPDDRPHPYATYRPTRAD